MEIISYIALFLLSLVGYSGGAVFRSDRELEPKPTILDLIIIILVWASAIYVKLNLSFNRWLLILVYVAASFLVAFIASLFLRKRPARVSSKPADQTTTTTTTTTSTDATVPLSPSLWERWKAFSKKLGGFQSRSLLSLFYFFIVSPFALVVKIFTDPLKIKHSTDQSHWLDRKALHSDQDDFRKQF